VDVDLARLLETFEGEIATLPAGSAPAALLGRTATAWRDALTAAAGYPDDFLWSRLYRCADELVAALGDRTLLPGLRDFLAENRDLCDAGAELATT